MLLYIAKSANVLNGLFMLAVIAAAYFLIVPLMNTKVQTSLPAIGSAEKETAEEPPSNTDVMLVSPTDLDAGTKRIMEELKKRGVLAQAIGAKPVFQYSI